jgi:hypothetical protein
MSGLMIKRATRVRLKVFAAAFAAAAQLCLAVVPLGEERFGADERAHIEPAGTSLHHAHDEATCAACVSQHILSAAEPGRIARFTVVASAPHFTTAALRFDSRTLWFFARSRAPPVTPV